VPADLDRIVAMEAVVFAEDAWSPRSIEAEFAQLGQSREILAATHDADIVGYTVLMYVGGAGDLPRIAVDPEFRRQGVASRLLDAALERTRELDLDHVLLEVAADNEPALMLYASKGFVEIDRRPRYYGGDRDAIVMRLAVGTDDDPRLAVDGGHG
jgi:ribosomal-protein-alanine N-acetyltransferase